MASEVIPLELAIRRELAFRRRIDQLSPQCKSHFRLPLSESTTNPTSNCSHSDLDSVLLERSFTRKRLRAAATKCALKKPDAEIIPTAIAVQRELIHQRRLDEFSRQAARGRGMVQSCEDSGEGSKEMLLAPNLVKMKTSANGSNVACSPTRDHFQAQISLNQRGKQMENMLNGHKKGQLPRENHLLSTERKTIERDVAGSASQQFGNLPPSIHQQPSLYCDICNVSCNSLYLFGLHQKGKKHQAKSKETGIQNNGRNAGKVLWCEVCRVKCSGMICWAQHKVGKKHKEALLRERKV